ncbi:MAG: hypothetical protein QF790_08285 [Gammaproteobacteria bacterium]|jgi:hypothetical protein|nr:hypothetical protein [Gammaproteobacteria bacterium]MDP6617143.1 hypothetical protein [Gammaproteobacteria bacterium]MDP6695352.1 hypothetical protein [Gammaproteobacteria bacterium]
MSPNKVIVSNHGLLQNRLALLLVAGLIVLGAWLMYELGLNRAGFNRIEAISLRGELDGRNDELQAELKTAREKIAVLETAAKIDREAYDAVEEELIGLQSRIQEQQEDIEFYKGIVNENDGTGLRIQDFKVVQGFGEQEFAVRLVLAQAFRIDRQISGSVEIVVEGLQRGEPARLGLGELATSPTGGTGRLNYSFRYFQDLKVALALPPDFVPERVHVIVRPRGKTSKTVEDFFVWDVKPS